MTSRATQVILPITKGCGSNAPLPPQIIVRAESFLQHEAFRKRRVEIWSENLCSL